LSLAQIAQKLGSTPTRIRNQLLRAGVKLRTKSEGAALRPGWKFRRGRCSRRLPC
jgi:hypothetical protein